ncbi:MAG: 50S ribosomal protein L21 [Candidatus Phytoplasma cynodontis]|uniref:50S ribosomal protein L21 n=1 Tax='Cynodon dactylon' phytoplasma TaxID=295320 RepID=UPI001265C2F7|nr:50S ribosomal protein L21 ['Cynodon dactylon' phytoplasma]KAB8121845.1 50S ribosomal protein L21 ['Cynodon dactylon' phytoplasma]WIA07830.1 MAG: 50S ribosomal protein L21 [Candidatus Phytoplasma cynodontis]
MFAIIKSGNKQYKVSPGQEVFVEKLSLNENENYLFDKVLALENDKNQTLLGNPFLKNVKIESKVIKQGKAKKIIVFKYKKRKKYRLKKGHRQLYTKLLITKFIF